MLTLQFREHVIKQGKIELVASGDGAALDTVDGK